MTQTQRILIYLKTGKSLTPLEALNKFGCFRLAARIADLRRDGHTIWTKYVQKDKKIFAAYKLSK